METRWVCWEVVVMRVELKANEEKKKGKSQRTMNEGGRAEKETLKLTSDGIRRNLANPS